MKLHAALGLAALLVAGPSHAFNVYYAVLHAHTTYSDGIGTPAEAYTYARDVANIDVLGLTEHTHMLTASEWNQLQATADSYCQDGVFVALRAQEFGNLNDFGHLAIYDCPYLNPNNTDNLLGSYQFIHFYNATAGFNHPNPIYGTNFNNLAFYPDYVENINSLEIRNGLRADNYEPQYIQALQNGWHVGPFANQDNHEGHWGDQGNPNSGGQVYLIGILANNLTKTEILGALRARRFYAIEVDPISDRIELEFYANGHIMGESIVSSAHLALTGHARAVNGASLFNRVDLFRDGEIIHTIQPIGTTIDWTFDEGLLNGESHFYFVRVSQVDGDHVWSSPIWVTAQVPVAAADQTGGGAGASIEILGPHPCASPVPFSIRIPTGPQDREASVEVFDTRGGRVGGMPERPWGAGDHTWVWEPKEGGRDLSAGVYFARLTLDGKPVACRRLVWLP
jgi:hypothetical protein